MAYIVLFSWRSEVISTPNVGLRLPPWDPESRVPRRSQPGAPHVIFLYSAVGCRCIAALTGSCFVFLTFRKFGAPFFFFNLKIGCQYPSVTISVWQHRYYLLDACRYITFIAPVPRGWICKDVHHNAGNKLVFSALKDCLIMSSG